MTTNGEMTVTSLLSKIMTENWEIIEWPLFSFKNYDWKYKGVEYLIGILVYTGKN